MMVADVLVPNTHQDISNHHDDSTVNIRCYVNIIHPDTYRITLRCYVNTIHQDTYRITLSKKIITHVCSKEVRWSTNHWCLLLSYFLAAMALYEDIWHSSSYHTPVTVMVNLAIVYGIIHICYDVPVSCSLDKLFTWLGVLGCLPGSIISVSLIKCWLALCTWLLWYGNATHFPWCHIYAFVNWVSIGSDNGLSPIERQAIIWTNAELWWIRPPETNFSEIWINIQNIPFMKVHLKISSSKWRPFCPRGD